MANEIRDEDVQFIEKVASNMILENWDTQIIQLHFPFVGDEDVDCGVGGGFYSRDVDVVKSELKKNGNLAQLVKKEQERLAKGESDRVIIPFMARELRRHPMIRGFIAGMEKGTGVDFKDTKINHSDVYENMKPNTNSYRYWQSKDRVIPIEQVDIAICSGALFAGKKPEELRKVYRMLAEKMYGDTGLSTFRDVVVNMVLSKEKTPEIDMPSLGFRAENYAREVHSAMLGLNDRGDIEGEMHSRINFMDVLYPQDRF